MADKSKFIGDLRGAVSDMLATSEKVTNLIAFFRGMGWAEADFTALLASSDISAAEMIAAIEAWEAAAVAAAAQGLILLKLKA